MATTPTYAIPYPIGTDRVMDGDNAMQAIAERVEAILSQLDPTVTGAPAGRRNVIRNGDMGVTQRGPAGVVGTPSGVYTGADGWLAWASGAALSLAVGNLGAGLQPWKNYVTANMSVAAAAAADYAFTSQRIEDVRTLAGQKVTLSFMAGSATPGRVLGIGLRQSFGTGGSPSATADAAMGSVVVNSTGMTRYSVTFTVPSIAGKTIGSNENSYLELRLWLGTGATNQPASGLSVAQGTQAAWSLNLTGVQLEAGPVATPFEFLAQQAQLAWCQRYFWRTPTAGGTGAVLAPSGICGSSTHVFCQVTFPVPMRAVPSMAAAVAAGNYIVTNRTGNVAANGLTLTIATTPLVADIDVGIAGGFTINAPAMLQQNVNAGAVLDFSAEL